MAIALNNIGYSDLPRLSGGTRLKVAFVGSSYIQQCHSVSATQIVESARSRMGWFNAFMMQTMNCDVWKDANDPLGRGFWGANQGVSGQTSTQILARIGTTIASRPDVVVLQQGTNNVTDPTTVISDCQATINLLFNAGIIVIYTSLTARGTADWSTTVQSQANYINQVMRQWCASSGKALYCDLDKYLCNPDTAEGRPYTFAIHSDSVHDNNYSAFYRGLALKDAFGTLFALPTGNIFTQSDDYDATNNPFGNVWTNPMVSINSAVGSTNGAITTGVTAGTGAASTSVGRNITVERASGTGTAVANVESRGSGLGNWQTVTCTPSGSGTSEFYIRHNSSTISHTVPAGTWMRFGCRVQLSTFGTALESGFQNVALRLDFRDSSPSTSLSVSNAMSQIETADLPNIAADFVLETPPMIIPENCDTFTPRLSVIVDDTKSGTGTIKAGGFYLRPCEDPSTLWPKA